MFEIRLINFFEGTGAVAAGATLGIEHFERMLEMLPGSFKGGPIENVVVCNLEGLEDATPSYVKATILAFHQCGRLFARSLSLAEHGEIGERLRPLNTVVVIQNASDAVADCVNEVFARRDLAILAGVGAPADQMETATLLGRVDPAALRALELATQFDEFQASDLHQADPEAAISVTGWNNRLAELYRQRLLRRRTEGRAHRFIPLVKNLNLYGQVLPGK